MGQSSTNTNSHLAADRECVSKSAESDKLHAGTPTEKKKANLVVSSMFIQERDDGFYMVLLNDVQNLRAFNQNTVQHLENA